MLTLPSDFETKDLDEAIVDEVAVVKEAHWPHWPH
jgi:hypothetical protein